MRCQNIKTCSFSFHCTECSTNVQILFSFSYRDFLTSRGLATGWATKYKCGMDPSLDRLSSLFFVFCAVKKESVRTMLAVVTYLRTQNLPKKGRGQGTVWDNNFWLDLDYLEVASAAQRCSAYFTALLYTEIWADIHK